MGKPTGFLEYERKNNSEEQVRKRILHYQEFHPPLNKKERREQGARCMNCGVPFCQSAMVAGGTVSGCPLHNLIPEWNDELYNENWAHALDRLQKTNNFPEFTGRVCPAPCEAACTCGLNDDPVTIKENELAVIENGYAEGMIVPRIPAVRTGKRVAVIGSGPAGLTVADQLNQRGHQVTIYEREDEPGGLLMYGIPNMKLEKRIIKRRVELMMAEGVTFVLETNIGVDIKAKELEAQYDAVVLCCGAKKPRDLNLPGREAGGIYFAVDFLASTTRSLLYKEGREGTYLSAKGKRVIIVGGGDTGNDCVATCIRHGAKSIVQLEMLPKLPDERTPENPWPQWAKLCKTDYGQSEAIEVFGSDPRIYQTTIKEFIADGNGQLTAVKLIKLEPKKDEKSGRISMAELEGSEEVMEAEMVLIAAGFLGCEAYVTEEFAVEQSARGNTATKEGSYHTGVEGIFTAGDMHRGQSLVVWAIAEGRACAKEVDAYLMGYTNMI